MYEQEFFTTEKLINGQNEWRSRTINLIASENVLSRQVRSLAGSDFAHRYAEGHPGERYYRGTSYIDEIESRLKTHLKILFNCDHTEVRPISEDELTVENVESIVSEMMDEKMMESLRKDKSAEFATWYGEKWRFRVGIFYQRNTLAVVIRKIDLDIPTFEQLGLPGKLLERFSKERRGMILLTGITGSGKSTTIASMVQYINENYGTKNSKRNEGKDNEKQIESFRYLDRSRISIGNTTFYAS